MKKRIIPLTLLIVLLITACQPASEPVPTAEPAPTTEPTIEPTIEPTAAPTTEPTATPIGQIFRDDFIAEVQPGWTWMNEMPENHSITSDGLQITADDICLLGDNFQNNLLMREVPQDVSFWIETKVTADTTSNFQQASLFLYEDAENYYSVNRGYCGICTTQGDGIYSDYMFRGEVNFNFKGVRIDVDEIYLKLVVDREGKWLTNYYATEPGKWVQLRKVPLLINVQQVGIGAGNCDGGQSDENLIAFFEYFLINELD